MQAIVLLSGGLDSYTAAAIARADGFRLAALTVHYGQRHAQELESARAVARALGADPHLELTVDLRAIGGSSLTSGEAVPRDRDLSATVTSRIQRLAGLLGCGLVLMIDEDREP